jgi:hypothetical protein
MCLVLVILSNLSLSLVQCQGHGLEPKLTVSVLGKSLTIVLLNSPNKHIVWPL